MKLLYFAGGISISETFIYELAKGLSAKLDTQLVLASEPFYKEGLNFAKEDISISKSIAQKLNYYLETRGKKIVFNWQQKKACRIMRQHIQNADVVYIDYGTNAVKILPLLIELQKPFVVHFHGYDITSALTFSSYKKEIALLFKYCKAIIVPSNHAKRLAILQGCETEKVNVIRYGASMPDVESYKEVVRDIDFLSVGRFTSKKNPVALIYSMIPVCEVYPKVKLHMVGDGPLLRQCKDLVHTFNLQKNVVFEGSLPHSKVIPLFKRAKVFVQHSVIASNGDQEGFPISLIEAALLRLPIISTIHSGIPENVIDGKTGFLVREFDYETMGEKMLYLIENQDIAEQMGQAGQKHISQLCNAETRIKQIGEIILNASNGQK